MASNNFDKKYFKGYVKALLSIEDIETFIESLPSKEQDGYKEFMRDLLSAMNSELLLYNKLLENAQSEEDLEFLQSQISKISQKRLVVETAISEILNKKNSEDEECDKAFSKHLIFLQSEVGNYYINGDAKDIPEEQMGDLIGLFDLLESCDVNTLHDGARSRKFNNNGNLKGLCEVKSGNVRLIYKYLDQDTILVITVLYKNQTNPKRFHESIDKRMDNAKKTIEKLKNDILLDPEQKEELIRRNEIFKQTFLANYGLRGKVNEK